MIAMPWLVIFPPLATEIYNTQLNAAQLFQPTPT